MRESHREFDNGSNSPMSEITKEMMIWRIKQQLDIVVKDLQRIDTANKPWKLQYNGEKNNFGAGFNLRNIRRLVAALEKCGIQIAGSEVLPDVPNAQDKSIQEILKALEKGFFTEVARKYRSKMDSSRRIKPSDKERWNNQEVFNRNGARELIAAIFPDFKDDSGRQEFTFDPYKKSYVKMEDSMWSE